MTATTMPMSSEPGTLRQARATVTRMEMMPTMKVGEVMSPRPTSVPAPAVIMPASHRPIVAMNRPGPSLDGVTQDNRDGVHDGLAQATKHEQQDDDALKEDDAHGHVPVAAEQTVVVIPAIIALTPKPDAQASGAVGEDAHADGHDAGAQAVAGERSASMPAPESTAGLTAMM